MFPPVDIYISVYLSVSLCLYEYMFVSTVLPFFHLYLSYPLSPSLSSPSLSLPSLILSLTHSVSVSVCLSVSISLCLSLSLSLSMCVCVGAGGVAQSVERATRCEEVPGSTPAVAARLLLVESKSV